MSVRLLADECVARTVINRLRMEGFDVVAASEVCPTDDDEEVLARAYEDERILITDDKDFGDLVVRLKQPTRGIVNLALGLLTASRRAEIVVARLRELGDRVIGSITTIEPGRMRMRPLPLE